MTTETDAAKCFARDTKDHKLTVLRDEGPYRHLRFASAPKGYSEYWFDLVTWPGVLVIRGDMETFAFSRTDDMFEFFRDGSRYGINPGYWGEKLIAPKAWDAKRYEPADLQRRVTEYCAGYEDQHPGLAKNVIERMFHPWPDWETGTEQGAAQALREYEFDGFRFADSWEWELRDWSYQFLWCCHAIVWGIRQYDEQKAAAATVDAPILRENPDD